jgi:1-aminocyclopropane-1-carboxylate deaminase/D-cysteine desulfhydrase-like pyridoxal-dependent ACC family enzyme
MALYHTVIFCQAELDQFLEGLTLNGVLDVLRQHPSQSRKVLEIHHGPLTAEVVDDLFHTEYSVQGNIKKEKEEAISF